MECEKKEPSPADKQEGPVEVKSHGQQRTDPQRFQSGSRKMVIAGATLVALSSASAIAGGVYLGLLDARRSKVSIDGYADLYGYLLISFAIAEMIAGVPLLAIGLKRRKAIATASPAISITNDGGFGGLILRF